MCWEKENGKIRTQFQRHVKKESFAIDTNIVKAFPHTDIYIKRSYRHGKLGISKAFPHTYKLGQLKHKLTDYAEHRKILLKERVLKFGYEKKKFFLLPKIKNIFHSFFEQAVCGILI